MDIHKAIRARASTRNFLNKPVSRRDILRILDAGTWGPSLATLQPAKFIVIRNKKMLLKIVNLVENKLASLGVIGRALFIPSTLRVLKTSPVLIAVYSTHEFQNLIKRFSKYSKKSMIPIHNRITEKAEICAISAAVQNMALEIEALGLGSCWLHVPLYCEKYINQFLGIKDELVCLLAVGHPVNKDPRSKRQTKIKIV